MERWRVRIERGPLDRIIRMSEEHCEEMRGLGIVIIIERAFGYQYDTYLNHEGWRLNFEELYIVVV